MRHVQQADKAAVYSTAATDVSGHEPDIEMKMEEL